MRVINHAMLFGRLTKDPEMFYTTKGTAKATLNIATDRVGRDGQKAGTDFHRVIVWGKLAETVKNSGAKGVPVLVVGNLQSGSYEKDGRKVYTYEVVAHEVRVLGNNLREPGEDGEPYAGGDAGASDEDIPY